MQNNLYLEKEVTELLLRLGVPANIKGYRFLRSAIMMVVEKPSLS